ncbi:MAG: LamG domain-containing protein [Phycisphaerae bacterium]|nr:LamG domain-containing protein [Phycisphaerae bacterium]
MFAWVKGGAAGQVVLSQGNGVNWLTAAGPNGALAGHGLISSAIITDGAWHRIGFVWDGTNRILYVDGVEAVRDVVAGLAGSTGGLYIGAGMNLVPGTFWSGIIDDVRIYDRVVKP